MWLVPSRKDGCVVLWDVVTQPSLRDKIGLNRVFLHLKLVLAMAVTDSLRLYKRWNCIVATYFLVTYRSKFLRARLLSRAIEQSL